MNHLFIVMESFNKINVPYSTWRFSVQQFFKGNYPEDQGADPGVGAGYENFLKESFLFLSKRTDRGVNVFPRVECFKNDLAFIGVKTV